MEFAKKYTEANTHIFTPSFIKALHASCVWWLQNNVIHSAFSLKELQTWQEFCRAIVEEKMPIHAAFEAYLYVKNKEEDAFFTGYFEPTLKGSFDPSFAYSIPLYTLPPEDKRRFTRHDIYEGALKGLGYELVYVKCPIDAFFLEIQGSGRILMEDGTMVRIGYSGQNGHPYTAIGKCVKDAGHLETVNFHNLKAFLKEDLTRADPFLCKNASYVFFKELDEKGKKKGQEKGGGNGENREMIAAPLFCDGPLGTQGLPLTPWHSVACDQSVYPFGLPILLDISLISSLYSPIQTFALTQDTGGAIKGKGRFDYFTGCGEQSEHIAGILQHKGAVQIFWPKDVSLAI